MERQTLVRGIAISCTALVAAALFNRWSASRAEADYRLAALLHDAHPVPLAGVGHMVHHVALDQVVAGIEALTQTTVG